MKIKKGDTVKVISGKDKGTTGQVIQVVADKGMLRVEGVAMMKRHYKPNANQQMPDGGILEKAGLIRASKVMLYSSTLERPVRVGYQFTDAGTKKRIARGPEGKDTALD